MLEITRVETKAFTVPHTRPIGSALGTVQLGNVAHAVWLWLRDRELQWTMLQRVAPWSSPLEAGARFDQALARAFDVPDSHQPKEQT